jgi:thiol-disulfide isomerase/thioredoxin
MNAWLLGRLWTVCVLVAYTDGDDPAKRYGELAKTVETRQNEYYSALQKARTREQKLDAEALYPRVTSYTAKFLEIAAEAPQSAGAFAACSWIVVNAPGGADAEEAYRILAEHHLDHKNLNSVQTVITNWPTVAGRKLLEAASENSTRSENKGFARLALGTLLATDARRSGDSAQPQRGEARRLLSSVVTEYPGLKVESSKSYAELARSILTKLGEPPKVGTDVGDRAPEISGPNTDGRNMRLSEFRGSVVVLEFWADWCPWCHEIYPFGRSLSYRFRDRPFVLLGVNSDRDQELVSQVTRDQQITWPNWWLGKNREIGQDYPVQRYPTTLVLDHTGVIRFRYFGPIDDDSLNRAASILLDEHRRDPNSVDRSRTERPAKKSTSRKKR